MTDLERRLRAAMHAGVDDEEAVAGVVLRGVYRRHRRHTMLIAGLAVLIAVAAGVPAAIATHGFGGTQAPSTSQTPAPAPPSTPPQPLPTKMTGLPMPAGTNLPLLTSDNGRSVWYMTATRQMKPIAGMPGLFAYERVTGGWASAWPLGGGTCPPQCWFTQYFVADGATRGSRIGVGRSLAPSDRAGAVWLLSYAHTITSTAKASASVQLYSTTGQLLGPSYRLPAGYGLVRGVGRYLLLSANGASRSTVNSNVPIQAVLWDPRSGHIVDRFPSVIDADAQVIAWSPQCHGCHVRLLNVLTGKSVTTSIPGGQPSGLSGSFTDDGALLVVQLPDGYLAVYNTRSRTLTVIPGTALNDNDWQLFGWLNGSHTLVVTAGCGRDCPTGPVSLSTIEMPDGPVQLAYWRPGESQLRVATVTKQDEAWVLQGWAY